MSKHVHASMAKREISSAFNQMDPQAFFRWSPRSYRILGSPFLAELAPRCAEDMELMTLAGEADPNQPYAYIFFGAVHALVLANPDDPFSSLFGVGPKTPVADDATFAALKDFCRRRREEIVAILKQRTVQFTQPVRASFLIALLGHVLRKGAKEPFSLIEVGCSAGLLTVFDHYYYDFGPLGQLGDPANPRVQVAVFRGGTPTIPDHMPKISERFGVDLNPIDPSDPAERRWIEGLMGPDMREERAELRAALDLRARIPLTTIKGDAMQVVPELLPKLKDTPMVFHSACLYQWPTTLQNKFHEMLLEASRERTIYRVAMDSIEDNPVRPARPPELGPISGPNIEMFAVTYRDGRADWDFLAIVDGFGGRAKWMAS